MATPARAAVEEAPRLADLWLDPDRRCRPNPVGGGGDGADWLMKTLEVWQKLCDPVAAQMTNAMSDLVPGADAVPARP